MRNVTAIVTAGAPSVSATLTFDQRRKSRQLLRLDDGSEAALRLPRGTTLRAGDLLAADDGVVIEVRAAPETLSMVRAEGLALVRAAYHLGNRHVPVQVGEGWLRYRHDHVLDGMVRALGLAVEVTRDGFEPEAGAYGGGHHHDHDHDHDDHHHDRG